MPEVLKHYELGEELGKGGMGAVYQGVDRRDGTRVAIKLLHGHLLLADPAFGERFEREAHVASLLHSPYSVQLMDYGFERDRYFLVMEYVDGQSLGALLRAGPLPVERALAITTEVARALEEAGARGVIHRDLKPDNILVTSAGRAKVTDFGIARQVNSEHLTIPGGFTGSVDYASPEQAYGEADHRSDIYALGATLYCMLAGRPPFSGGPPSVVLSRHRSSPLPTAPLGNLPDAVTNIIRRAMEKDPRDRYQTASEMVGALERARVGYESWLKENQRVFSVPTMPPPLAIPGATAATAPPGIGDVTVANPPPGMDAGSTATSLPDATVSNSRLAPQLPVASETVPALAVRPTVPAKAPERERAVAPPHQQKSPGTSRKEAPGGRSHKGLFAGVGATIGLSLVVGLGAFFLLKDDGSDAESSVGLEGFLATAEAERAATARGGASSGGDTTATQRPGPTRTATTVINTPTAALLPSVTPPPGSPSRLSSGANAEALNSPGCTVQVWAQPTESTTGDYATNRVLGTLCNKDEVTVVTNTPPSSTTVSTEGYIWWRVLVKKSGTVGWVKEVKLDGSGARFLDLTR
jgi:serine/threonine-protein kinase